MTRQPVFVFDLDCDQGGVAYHRMAVATGPSEHAARSAVEHLCQSKGQTVTDATATPLARSRLSAARDMAATLDGDAALGPAYLAKVDACDCTGGFTSRGVDMTPLDGSTEDFTPPELAPMLFNDDGTYALLDGALIMGLLERLEASGLPFACLYGGDAATQFADTAPYIVQLAPKAPLTRALFSAFKKDGIQRGLWADEAGIIVQSPASLRALRRHFRRFTYLQDDTGKRVFFRFYAPVTLRTLIANMAPEDLADFGKGVTRFTCPGKPAGAFVLERA
ncbi:DUF4123 domain-containing protein [Litoreibacter arenae]|uniref:DUF4123 domain-containing protein n=1 Tax=Litoreibacter arenae DSM 19593 TaxID=1123360 RepID=S9QCV2_9RHOB|nr:DUF4123 domain-containing protein [Litoreibacter arenae]EPX77433.1 hypothetical protein thalar_03156 [Litoreibacter arenae DSM 19593]